MKRKILKLMFLAIVTAGASGTALATGNPPLRPEAERDRSTLAENMSGCHDSADATATWPPEAPWVSLALTHAEHLRLTADQIRQMEGLRGEFERAAATQSRAIATAERTLKDILTAKPVDLSRVDARLKEIGTLSTTLRLRRIETLLAGRDVLSLEQQGRLQELASTADAAVHKAMMGGIPQRRAPAPSGGSM